MRAKWRSREHQGLIFCYACGRGGVERREQATAVLRRRRAGRRSRWRRRRRRPLLLMLLLLPLLLLPLLLVCLLVCRCSRVRSRRRLAGRQSVVRSLARLLSCPLAAAAAATTAAAAAAQRCGFFALTLAVVASGQRRLHAHARALSFSRSFACSLVRSLARLLVDTRCRHCSSSRVVAATVAVAVSVVVVVLTSRVVDCARLLATSLACCSRARAHARFSRSRAHETAASALIRTRC